MRALCRRNARRLGKAHVLRQLSRFLNLDASSGSPYSRWLMPSKLLRAVSIVTCQRQFLHDPGRRALSSPGAMNVFDRVAKRRQKNRAAASPDADTYDYLRKEVRITCTWTEGLTHVLA